MKSTTCFG